MVLLAVILSPVSGRAVFFNEVNKRPSGTHQTDHWSAQPAESSTDDVIIELADWDGGASMSKVQGGDICPLQSPIELVYRPWKGKLIQHFSISVAGEKNTVDYEYDRAVVRSGNDLRLFVSSDSVPQLPGGAKGLRVYGKMSDKGRFWDAHVDFVDGRGNVVDSPELRKTREGFMKAMSDVFVPTLPARAAYTGCTLFEIDARAMFGNEFPFRSNGNGRISYVIQGLKKYKGRNLLYAEVPEGTTFVGHVPTEDGKDLQIDMVFGGSLLMDYQKGYVVSVDATVRATIHDPSSGVRLPLVVTSRSEQITDSAAPSLVAVPSRVENVRAVNSTSGWTITGRLLDEHARPVPNTQISIVADTSGEELSNLTDSSGRFSFTIDKAQSLFFGLQGVHILADRRCLSRLILSISPTNPANYPAQINGQDFVRALSQKLTALRQEYLGGTTANQASRVFADSRDMIVWYGLSQDEFEAVLDPNGVFFMNMLRNSLGSFFAHSLHVPGVAAGATKRNGKPFLFVRIPASSILAGTKLPKLANPVWISVGGKAWQVGLTLVDNTEQYMILDSSGNLAQLSEADLKTLAVLYDMKQTGYLKVEKLAFLKEFQRAIEDVRNKHYYIGTMVKVQEEFINLGVVGTAVYFSGGTVVLNKLSNIIADQVKDMLWESPKTLAREWARCQLQLGLSETVRLVESLEFMGSKGLGTSAEKPVPTDMITEMYQQAVFIDTYTLAAAELLRALQPDSSAAAQFERLGYVAIDSTADVLMTPDKKLELEAIFKTYGLLQSLSESIAEVAAYMKIVNERKAHWSEARGGSGKNIREALTYRSAHFYNESVDNLLE